MGFLSNLVIMRNYFCGSRECEEVREACEKERATRWKALDQRLESIERCMGELKDGWKANYKALCEIEATLRNYGQRVVGGN